MEHFGLLQSLEFGCHHIVTTHGGKMNCSHWDLYPAASSIGHLLPHHGVLRCHQWTVEGWLSMFSLTYPHL